MTRKGFLSVVRLGCCALLAWTTTTTARVQGAETITVFAAISLTEALREIAADYKRRTGDTVALNLGASSLLARQIQEGAPADLFLSAGVREMDALEKLGLLQSGSRRTLLSNSLAIVMHKDSSLPIRSAHDLADPQVKRIALADPRVVPAGEYARNYLEKIGLWTSISNKIVPTDNVRAALAAVESGNVEAGIVYATDAHASDQVRVTVAVAASDGPSIRYPVAVLKAARHQSGAQKFLSHLQSGPSQTVFKRHGFLVPERPGHDDR